MLQAVPPAESTDEVNVIDGEETDGPLTTVPLAPKVGQAKTNADDTSISQTPESRTLVDALSVSDEATVVDVIVVLPNVTRGHGDPVPPPPDVVRFTSISYEQAAELNTGVVVPIFAKDASVTIPGTNVSGWSDSICGVGLNVPDGSGIDGRDKTTGFSTNGGMVGTPQGFGLGFGSAINRTNSRTSTEC
jgi:hypothetical protein